MFDGSLTMGKAPVFLRNTLKMTMTSKADNNIITMIRQNQAKLAQSNEDKPEHLKMKTSGDTACDLNASKSTSFMKK